MGRSRRSLVVCVLALVMATATAQAKLTVAAAANLSSLGDELKSAFLAKNPKLGLDFVYGASGALSTQIQNGAPFDAFMSADTGFPQKLVDAGLAFGQAKVYASGRLILLSTSELPLKEKGLSVLTEQSVKQFAIANPETAPYGKASLEALNALKLYESTKAKIVVGQTITQALQFTLSATGIGFVNKSALYTKEVQAYSKEGANWIEVDPGLYSPIDQSFILLNQGKAKPSPAAQAFADFLGSPEARAVFQKYGYAVP